MAKCRCRKSIKYFQHKDVELDEETRKEIDNKLKEISIKKKDCFDCDVGNCCYVKKIDKHCYLCVMHHLNTKEETNGYCYKRSTWE